MSVKALDKLGEAIVDAGYDWTYDMRKAYEDGIRESRWKDLTEDEVSEIIDKEIGFNSCWGPEYRFARAIEAKLKEKNT